MVRLMFLLYITSQVYNVKSQSTGDLRINGGSQENKGRLEILYNDTWGTVCDDDFDNIDASVACRQLGYCSGILLRSEFVTNGNETIWLDDVTCSGNESRLIDCTYTKSHNCHHGEDVGIDCDVICPEIGDLRLVDSTTSMRRDEGRLEIYLNRVWGTVCEQEFDDIDAAVACRQLGYRTGVTIRSGLIYPGTGPIWLYGLGCNGSESKLTDCTKSYLTYCSHYFDVGIQCLFNNPTKDHGNLRLIGGQNKNEGRLEINLFDEWGTVCHDYFSNFEAVVACKQLGYCTGIVLPSKNVDDGNGTIWLANVDCEGNEEKLVNCSYDSYVTHCGHQNDVGIRCFITCPTQGHLRIVESGKEHEGRLEIYMNGVWGTVCRDFFDDIDATVACQQLGFCSGKALHSYNVVDGTGVILLDDLHCSGIESRLMTCSYDPITTDCGSYEDIGVSCSFTCPTTVNGGWSTWSPWSACFCGTHQFRTRNCTNPTPMYGGQYCEGYPAEQRNCSSFCYSRNNSQQNDSTHSLYLHAPYIYAF
ncbi:neurotrypsin-like [Mytilus galloprovincialis]|uniref:neurotrypsin-like n=1 Tax=Mytilus galloprovincialis TaxID=29158 RepID=UPI003F7B545C